MVPGKLGKLSRSVSIIGIGATPFMNINDDPDLLGLTEGDCFGYAALAAMEDAGLEPRDVDYFYHGSANPKMFNNAVTPNMQVAEWFGMRGRGSVHHSEACCTGYVALEQAVLAVASGAYDIVLSGGVEMATGLPDGKKPACFRRPMTTEDIWPDLDSIIDRSYTRALGGGNIGQDDWIDMYRVENGLTDRQIDVIAGTPRVTVRYTVPDSSDAEEIALALMARDAAHEAIDAVAVAGRDWTLRRVGGRWIPVS